MAELFLGDDSRWEILNSCSSGDDQNEGKKPVVETAAKNTKYQTPRTKEADPSSVMVSKKRRSKESTGEELKDEKLKEKSIAAGGPSSADHDFHIWTERERRKKMRSMFSDLHALLPHLPPKVDKSTIVNEAVRYIKKSKELLEKLEKQKEERRLLLQGTSIISCWGGSPYLNMNSARNKLLLSSAIDSREAFLANRSIVQLFSPSTFPRINDYSPAPAPFTTWASPNVVVSISGENAHINIFCLKKLGLLTSISFFLEKHILEAFSIQVSSDHYCGMYMIHSRPNKSVQDFIAQGILSPDEKKPASCNRYIDFYQFHAVIIMSFLTNSSRGDTGAYQ